MRNDRRNKFINNCFRVVNWWKIKYTDVMFKGYKINLQNFLGTRFPNSILNFFFKYKYRRVVSITEYFTYLHLVLKTNDDGIIIN